MDAALYNQPTGFFWTGEDPTSLSLTHKRYRTQPLSRYRYTLCNTKERALYIILLIKHEKKYTNIVM